MDGSYPAATVIIVLSKTPPLVPAYTVAGVAGSIARLTTTPPSGPPVVQMLAPAKDAL